MSDLIPDEERAALVKVIADNMPYRDGIPKVQDEWLAGEVLAAGFRRVSPVTREALTGGAARSDSIPALIAWNHKRSIMYSDQASAAWRAGIYGDEHPRALESLSAQHSATADALESLSVSPPAEVEWEYGILHRPLPGVTMLPDHDHETFHGEKLVRRRKAGPWVPVSPESEGKK